MVASSSGGGVTIESDAPPAAATGTPPPDRARISRVDPVAESAALDCLRGGQRTEALKLLADAYGAPLAAFARRVVRDRALAEDVRQHVFLRASEKLDTFEGRGSLWGWLCGIAYHRCLDELKRSKRTQPVDDFDVWPELPGSSDSSMDPDRLSKQRALEHCLGELSQDMRAQVLMRCFLDLSYAEISELVGDAPGTVQVRISRILPRLRRCLLGKGVLR